MYVYIDPSSTGKKKEQGAQCNEREALGAGSVVNMLQT